ncbi:hypothetical protein NM688_g3943 [Phlebia brevispora]|uniref:Uncharacterized protein n=1 Tax=Phlebia brevispora TaxID=194682 RepID=A0ACC1T4A6_9APHY|nr:hypothetical protein NM688_g3943 [Phlebia brevispora]
MPGGLYKDGQLGNGVYYSGQEALILFLLLTSRDSDAVDTEMLRRIDFSDPELTHSKTERTRKPASRSNPLFAFKRTMDVATRIESVTPGKLLVDLFGYPCRDIRAIVNDYDFSKTDLSSESGDDYLHEEFAPSLIALSRETLECMEQKLKVSISGTVRALKRVPISQRSFDKVIEALTQSPVTEPVKDAIVNRTDMLIKNEFSSFMSCGWRATLAVDSVVVRQVGNWLRDLIQDRDVLMCTGIDADVVRRMLTQVNMYTASVYESHSFEKTMIDVGVVQFPSTGCPYFKVYRIKLTVWTNMRDMGIMQRNRHGIAGDYVCHVFKPRDDIIERMSQEAVNKAVLEAEGLFDN